MKSTIFFGLLALSLSVVCATNDNRQKCDYTVSNSKLRSKCTRANIDTIPSDLNPYINVLVLLNSQIKMIRDTELDKYPHLIMLNVSNSVLNTLENGAFDKVDKLETLDLSANNFGADPLIPECIFCNTSIQNLYMKSNSLTNTVFDKIKSKNLQLLDLSHNKISMISIKDIAPFCRLKEIDLRYNPIKFNDHCNCYAFMNWLLTFNITAKLDFQCENDLDDCLFDTVSSEMLDSRKQMCENIDKDVSVQYSFIICGLLIIACIIIFIIIGVSMFVWYCKIQQRKDETEIERSKVDSPSKDVDHKPDLKYCCCI